MTRLKYLLEQFGLMLAEGREQIKAFKLETSDGQHRLSFAEDMWPDVKPALFKPFEFKAVEVAGEAPEKSLLRAMVTDPGSVHKISRMLSTFKLDRQVRWFFEEIKEVQQIKKNSPHLFDAFTQPGGNEVEAYFIRPECAHRHPDLYLKAQSSPSQATIDQLTSLGMYRKAAQVVVPPEISPENVAEFTYMALQNEQSLWADKADIIVLTDSPRSAQVGDVFVIGSYGELVKGQGFERLIGGFWPRDPEAEVARHDWSSDGPGL